MRLVTFNILHGRSPADRRVDLHRFAHAVQTLDADLLALQEVDRGLSRSGGADLTAIAAEAMRATDHHFAAALLGSPEETWTPATGAEPPGSPGYGVALLSRHPVRAWQVVRLPALRGRTEPAADPAADPDADPAGPTERAWDEPRVAIAAQVDSPEGVVSLVGTHLSFWPFWNRRQLDLLMAAVDGKPRPLVLAGDLNMQAATAARVTGLRPLTRHPTYPAHRPTRQLDHVLAAGRVEAVHAHTRRMPISDHLALVVDLRLPG